MKAVRILPVLIIVAMLSFSVRLVEVIDGIVTFKGPSAYAVETEEETTTIDEGPLMVDDGEADAEEEKPEEIEPIIAGNEDFPDWRDPSDDDPSYETTRMEVLGDLSERRKELDKKERSIETREALLKAAEQELDRKLQELNQLKSELKGLLEAQSQEEQARVTSLVKIYEGMKPKDAARIFDTLDLDILVDVVAQMSERKLSPILAAMNSERARTLTIMLAEQKQLPTLP